MYHYAAIRQTPSDGSSHSVSFLTEECVVEPVKMLKENYMLGLHSSVSFLEM